MVKKNYDEELKFGIDLCYWLSSVNAQKPKHTFTLGTSEFLLDGQPYQIISGEMHPARIPAEYWRHRIQMAKAMGCNTISAYIFWNYHESEEGVYDFTTGNHNLARVYQNCTGRGDVAYIKTRSLCLC